ncbi:MAG: phosphotransferase [Candidatus Staskawiczbacteria bacterium]|nr:phosphotransferase [Candidatus Staskawiczbacteria bacterium]
MKSEARFNGFKNELSQIFNFYELKVLDAQRLEDGMINSSYKLITEGGLKFVLRVYKNGVKTNKDIQKELLFMGEMENHGIPVPVIIDNIYGTKLSVFNDVSGAEWRAIVMTFVEGRHLKSNDFDIIPEFAIYQAKMHLASDKLEKDFDAPNFKAMIDWMDKEFEETKSKKITEEVLSKIENIYNELKQDIDLSYKDIVELPYGDVHLDYDSDNLIVNDKKIKAILDFDDISCQPFILDIANSLLWWLFKNKQEDYKKILQSYFKNYRKTREISEKELKFLNLFLRMRNLTLMCLLYVNTPEEVRYEKVNQGINLDPLLTEVKWRL